MKRADTLLSLILLIGFTTILVLGCKKDQDEPEEPVTNPPPSALADTLSNHLRLIRSTKKQGIAPSGPSSSTLKTSIRDTLFLSGNLPWPVQFLHTDPTKNVAGAWIQIRATASIGFASYYFEVPELRDMEESDTISVIMIEMNPDGLELPQTFETKIVPYDKDKQPLGETILPTKLDDPRVKLPGNGSSCGLPLQSNEHWSWEFSYVSELDANLDFIFYNQPGKKFSNGGVDIEGSCCNGTSAWPQFCTGQLFHNQTLHFATYYTIKYENFWFLANNTFSRQTLEDSPVPLPEESDFCAGGSGKVKESLKLTDYYGTWEIRPISNPSSLPPAFAKNTHELRLTTTGGTGVGYGNPGGLIHQLDCELGFLVMVQGNGASWHQPLVKCYTRVRNGEPRWYHLQ